MMSHFILRTILLSFMLSVIICKVSLPGGWTDVDPNQSGVKNATNFAVNMYNKESNSVYMKQLVTIVSANSQVVSGRKLNVTFVIGETSCSKNRVRLSDPSECALSNNSTKETCNAIIWEQKWLKKIQLLHIKCCPSETTDC